jgi:hypothetical protein
MLEINIPRLPNIEERSLVIQVDDQSHSVAQLGEWANRVNLTDNESKKVAWNYTKSHKEAVRFIACCAIINYAKITYRALPENISIFDSAQEKDSEKYKNLIKWMELKVGR